MLESILYFNSNLSFFAYNSSAVSKAALKFLNLLSNTMYSVNFSAKKSLYSSSFYTLYIEN